MWNLENFDTLTAPPHFPPTHTAVLHGTRSSNLLASSSARKTGPGGHCVRVLRVVVFGDVRCEVVER